MWNQNGRDTPVAVWKQALLGPRPVATGQNVGCPV